MAPMGKTVFSAVVGSYAYPRACRDMTATAVLPMVQSLSGRYTSQDQVSAPSEKAVRSVRVSGGSVPQSTVGVIQEWSDENVAKSVALVPVANLLIVVVVHFRV